VDVYQKIQEMLQAHRENVLQAIDALEDLHTSRVSLSINPIRKRRGRSSMGPEERKQVSLRMKRYWAARKSKTATKRKRAGQQFVTLAS
jgi:hypothetical protein